MFSQTAIKKAVYRISLTGEKDTIKCILCGETDIIDFSYSKKQKRVFIKKFEKKHTDRCRKGK